MDSPTLLSLPAEVRLNIYSFLFEDSSIHIDSNASSKPGRQGNPVLAPLLQTCKFLRSEAEPSYFSRVTVCSDIYQGVPPTGLINWLRDIGEINVSLLRKFELKWNNYVNITLDLKHNAIITPETILSQIESQQPAMEERCIDLTKSFDSESPTPMPISSPEHISRLLSSNPTTSTLLSANHTLSIKGIPRLTRPELYWKLHGTQEYCSALSSYVSPRLAATLEQRTKKLHLTVEEIQGFVADVDLHAGHLRWLWYW
jgi:hypothetical protein